MARKIEDSNSRFGGEQMNQHETEQALQQELESQPSNMPVVYQGQVQLPAPSKKDKKHQAAIQRMVRNGQTTAMAVRIMTAVPVYAQGQLEVGSAVMFKRLSGTERPEVVQAFMVKTTGKLMNMMQAGVMAVVETLPGRLGEDL